MTDKAPQPAAARVDVPIRELHLPGLAIRLALLGAVAVLVAVHRGFDRPPIPLDLNRFLQVALFFCYTGFVWVQWARRAWHLHDRMAFWTPVILQALALLGGVAAAVGFSGAWGLFELVVLVLLCTNAWWLNVAISRKVAQPAALLAGSFLVLIFVGTLLLKLPLAAVPGPELTWLDAAFTMTSAVCVTGLIVRDTATAFTPFGQALIGVFIQIGGLGIIIFGSMFAAMLGSRSSLREDLHLSRMLNDQPVREVASLVRFIVFTTLVLEVGGALLMMPLWNPDLSSGQRLGFSLFHAVSAYCNAGFSLMSNSLEDYRYSAIPHVIVAPLIVLGGLGFPVLHNFWRMVKARLTRRRRTDVAAGRLTLHTKVVLTTTAVLYLYGVAGMAVARLAPNMHSALGLNVTANRQDPQPLDAGRVGAALADASFMSVTARTAGFNTVNMEALTAPEVFILMTLMIVGGSPGGTAGGMKTTAAALLFLSIVADVRQRRDTEAFFRRLTEAAVRQAGTLAACYLGLVAVATLLLCYSEPFPFHKLLFEATSAVSVTGLSLGITGSMTSFGKCVIIGAMFLGRVGPLTLLVILMLGGGRGRAYSYPREEVVMG